MFVSCVHSTGCSASSSKAAGHHFRCLSKGQFSGLQSLLFHLFIRTTIIFHKADLSVVVPDQVLQREEAPAVRPHGDFTGQSQGFGGRLQQRHLVPVTDNRADSSERGVYSKTQQGHKFLTSLCANLLVCVLVH